jgi:hypothetical protein
MVVLSILPAFADDAEAWQKSTDDALAAYSSGDFKKAEKLLRDALEDAEKLGEQDDRL